MRKDVYFAVILLLLLDDGVISRPLPNVNYLVVASDGLNEEVNDSSSLIRLDNSEDEEVCEQMYGFLPCSRSLTGHLFLILVYEYLLFHGESYVASGGERIFKILGPGIFGASAFQIIGSLPEALILLATGLLSKEEMAEEYVLTGVGLLAGSTILLLTLVWGTCTIFGAESFPNTLLSTASNHRKHNPLERLLISLWPGYGVVTDFGSKYTARIMLISVIPLILIQMPRILRSSYVEERVFVLIILLISITFMLSYFFYQFFQPWIQRRQLLYIKHEHLVIDILKHVQNETMGRLLTDNGSPNVSTIRRLFEERDHDKDKVISFSELKEFLQEIKLRRVKSDKDNTTADIMKEFDIDNDEKITLDEFVNGMSRWLDDTKDAMNKRYHSVKSLKDMYQVLKPWIQKKREEREMMRHLIPDIVLQLQNSAYGSLLAGDGTPDVPAIKRLFEDIDRDKDGCISNSELKELMSNITFGIIPYDPDQAASKIMEELDISGDHLIDEDEFVSGLSKWISLAYNQNLTSEENEEEAYQKTWEQTDQLVKAKIVDKSAIAWMKAVSLLLLGVFILGVLAEPLIHSVRNFSKAANVPSFFVAFIFVPLATNARIAVSALSEARRKKLHTTSLALSEIYGTVFVNNVLGLAVLLSMIYFRGISWEFSIEVLMVLVVSAVVGCLASFSTIFTLWTSILAYFLYPLSLVLVYFFADFNWLS